MHDSKMMADVGGIENVSGSRIAMPLAPPRPGSTPISTPSTMPIIISIRLNGVRTTAKPWNSDEISAMALLVFSVAEEAQRLQRALEQRHLEPHLEHQERDGHHREADAG